MSGSSITLYHDGSCTVCRLEIGHFKRQPGAQVIRFVDVSDPQAHTGPDLSRAKAMGRFHVRLPSGELHSGGAAFAEIWKVLTFYWSAATAARLPAAAWALDTGYDLAAPLRPHLARVLRYVV